MTAPRLRRAYEPPGEDDGQRILVDRVWPRGVRRDEARLACWLREVAPSTGLRQWYGHDPARWPVFRRRYLAELFHGEARPAFEELLGRINEASVTLVFGARDEPHSHAVVIRDAVAVSQALGMPPRRRGAIPAVDELSAADWRSLEEAAGQEMAASGHAAFEADVLVTGWLAEYLDARISGLCHEGAVEVFANALHDAARNRSRHE